MLKVVTFYALACFMLCFSQVINEENLTTSLLPCLSVHVNMPHLDQKYDVSIKVFYFFSEEEKDKYAFMLFPFGFQSCRLVFWTWRIILT